MTIDELIAKVREHLNGIDRTQDDSRGGYWQTADGALAGKIILRGLEQMLRANWPDLPPAPDHVANASNMVAPPALPSDIQQALIAASDALADIAEGRASKVLLPLEWAEGRAFRALEQIRPVMRQLGVRTSEPPAVPPVVKESLTAAPALPLPAGEGE